MASAPGGGPAAKRPRQAQVMDVVRVEDEAPRREVAHVARNEAVKRLRGQKVSRVFKEVSIRNVWSAANPHGFVEPTSRANLTGWIRDREYRTVFGTAGPPVVDADPALHTAASGHFEPFNIGGVGGVPSWSDVAGQVRKHVGQSNHSSFIATRYGLCRFRNRVPLNEGQGRFELIPWCAPTVFPSAWVDNSAVTTLRLGKGVIVRPTADHPHPFIGSGCLPVFFHDCPSPYSFPIPPITEGVDRFGPRVMSKFRELKIHIEPFSYTTTATGFPTVPNQTVRAMLRKSIDPKPWARVIIFKRKKDYDNSMSNHTLYPPIFPEVPVGSSLSESRTTALSDVTIDTPMHSNRVRYWPSSVPGSMFTILEDFVVDLVPDKLPDRGDAQAGSTAAGSVFAGYGTVNPSYTSGAHTFDSAELNTRVDSDGLPHHFKRTTISRHYRDNGRFISFEHTGMDPRTHEGIPPRNPNVRPVMLQDAGTDPIPHLLGGNTGERDIELDMCTEEMFVTVVTGAYLTLANGASGVPETDYPGVQQKISVLDPRSVCGPALVSVETNWWYADAGIDGPPRDFKWVDTGGNEVQVEVAPRPTQTAL